MNYILWQMQQEVAEFVYLRSGNVKMEKMMEQQQLKKCPIGIQTFEEIINKGYLYIDKTEYVYRMGRTAPPNIVS
jgi:uncharacterized membrane protein